MSFSDYKIIMRKNKVLKLMFIVEKLEYMKKDKKI